MNLAALPAFTDNYIWLLHAGGQAIVVDPGDAAPVRAALAREALQLAGILVTHHHGDHTGGIEALLADAPVPVWGPATERIPGLSQPLRGGEQLELLGLRFAVLAVPGHTAGHLAYYSAGSADTEPLLFCGDTLFSGGCGRLFEGSPAQLHDSLAQFTTLPPQTRVCCAHEYTLSNLRFAQAVESDNPDLARYVLECRSLREADQPTLPSRMGQERLINPFLRCDQPAVIATARQHGAASNAPVEVLAALRHWKNDYR
ncbi:MAG: hypothetical protein RJA44_961 [Pseudomonadota bacterium]